MSTKLPEKILKLLFSTYEEDYILGLHLVLPYASTKGEYNKILQDNGVLKATVGGKVLWDKFFEANKNQTYETKCNNLQ